MTNKFVPLVAVDDGSGNIAYRFTDSKGNVFENYTPSVIERGSSAGGSFGGMSDHIWETEDGERYTVKSHSLNPERTCYPDYQVSAANRVLVNDALAVAGLGDKKIIIGCTLPAEQYYNRTDSQNPRDEARITQKQESLFQHVMNVYGAYGTPEICYVRVFPEVIPAYVYCALNEDGTLKDDYPLDHKTLVVDLGQFTDDIALVSDGFNVLDYHTGENGVHKMIEHFKMLLQRDARDLGLNDVKNLSKPDLEDIINRGYIGSTLETEAAKASRIDVKEQIREAAQFLSDLIYEDMLQVTPHLMTLTRIVFVGGGANWLSEQAMKWHHTVDIPEQPEMAIVRGIERLMLNKSDELRKEAKLLPLESVEEALPTPPSEDQALESNADTAEK